MNIKIASLFTLLIAIFAISSVSAIIPGPTTVTGPITSGINKTGANTSGLQTVDPCMYIDCPSVPNMLVTVDQDEFYINKGDTLEINFTVQNLDNTKTGSVQIQFDDTDDDYKNYLEVPSLSQVVEVAPNSSETVKFKIYVKNLPPDTYTIKFNLLKFYTNKYGNIMEKEPETKKITLHVDDYDPIDIGLDNDVVCYNEELPTRKLIFSNDSSKNYYIKPKVKGNDDLWPYVKSDIISIPHNDETYVEIQFRKKAPIGTYELKIDQDLYYGTIYSNPKSFEKTLTLRVENCKATKTSFYLNNQTTILKQNDKAQVNFDFYNNTDSDMVVDFDGSVNDQTMSVAFPNNSVIVKSNQDYYGKFYVYTSENTTGGLKEVTVTATTPYTSFTKTMKVNVAKANYVVTADPVDAPVGLESKQKITIQNNTTSDITMVLATKSNNSDIILLSNNIISLKAGETKTIYAKILPKTVGAKNYTLEMIVNGSETDKLITYSSTYQVGLVEYVKNYPISVNAVSGRTTTIPIEVTNPNNSETTLSLSLLANNEITSETSQVLLEPNESKTVNLKYTVNTNASKTIKAIIEVLTVDTGSVEKKPLNIVVRPDTLFTQSLIINKAPTSLEFVKGQNTKTTLSVTNNNAFEVKDAIVKLLDIDGNVLGQRTFNIPANKTLNIDVTYKINSDSDTTGTIVVNANGSENSYDVVYKKRETGFFKTGLFGLGLGGTISIILGAVIVVLIILYFSLRKPTKDIQ